MKSIPMLGMCIRLKQLQSAKSLFSNCFDIAWKVILHNRSDAIARERLGNMFPSDEALDKLSLSLLHKTVLGLNKLDLATLLASITRFTLDEVDAQGRTALYWAAIRGDEATVSMLIKHGACINIRNYEGNLPLVAAAFSGNEACVWHFLESGLDVDANYANNLGWTPLMHFCYLGTSVKLVERLISKGADLESRTQEGYTALMTATQELRDDHVQCLIAHGANLNSVENNNRSLLHIAVHRCNSGAARLLFHHRADHTIKTKAGETLLHFAAHHGDLKTLDTLHLFDLGGINVRDRVTGFSDYQKVKGLVGLTALQIAEQRQDATPEWMDKFRQLIRSIESPETRSRAHDLGDDVTEEFQDALEY